METPIGASLGAMGSLRGKLQVLLAPGCTLPKGVKDRMHLLRDDLEEVSAYLEDLSELEGLSEVAKCWMKGVRDLSFDMEDYHDSLVRPARANIRTRFVRGARHVKIPSRLSVQKLMILKIKTRFVRGARHVKIPSRLLVQKTKILKRFKWQKQIVNKLSEFRLFVQEAIERHEKYELHYCTTTFRRRFVSVGPMLPTSYEETSDLVIDGRMDEFINSLSNDGDKQLKVISILGSSCLGKTTFAKVLSTKFGGQFDCRAFIRVSKNPDMKIVFSDMLSQVQRQRPPKECNELDLIDTTRKHLQDKRYLIIIDDLWTPSVWNTVKHAFPKGSEGSRIITTTQIEEVALACCCYHSEHVFEMKTLDVDHSRKLFFGSIFGSESDCPEQFKEDSNKIVEICGGLPLATINIARLLARQSILSMDLLTYICDSLSSCLWENSTSEKMRQILNFSYNNLPRYLKTCLLYLSKYPEGYTILKEDLVKQWLAEGYIHATGGQDMEKVAGEFFDELIDRRFIQPVCINFNNEVVSCTVHDVVRELIACKSAEENFMVVVDSSRKNVALSHKVRRLSILFGNAKYAKISANIRKSQVRSLAFFGLFDSMPCSAEFKLLRVLNLQLSGYHGGDTINLTGIAELFHLRYLKIASDVCVQLPNHMRGLQCLETLDMHAKVTAVPWDIFHLLCLLHLRFPVDEIFRLYMVGTVGTVRTGSMRFDSLWSLGMLTNLQDLHLTCSTPSSKHLQRMMEALGLLLGAHGNIKTLSVSSGSHKNNDVYGASEIIIYWDGLAPPSLLERFEWSLHSCIFSRIPYWMKELANLRTLKIAVRELMSVDIIGGLPALTALSLYVEKTPVERIVFDRVGFRILNYFKFSCSTPVLKFQPGTMPNLRKLKLCFSASGVDQHVAASVTIDLMPGLKEISAKIRAACAADAESALRTTVNNHRSNPRIKLQLLDCTTKKLNDQEIDKVQEVLAARLKRSRNFVCLKWREFRNNRQYSIELTPNRRMTKFRNWIEPTTTRWKLEFQNPLQLPIFTGCKIQDANGGPLQIILVDGDPGLPLELPQSLRINLVLLFSEPAQQKAVEWSKADFQCSIVEEFHQAEQPRLLAGDTQLIMSDGRGTVNELWFTDNTQWLLDHNATFDSRLRIGARVAPDTYDGARIREAMTEPFDVREIPPLLGDDVWRLHTIAKGGALHRTLSQHHVKTVQDFLRMLVVKPDELHAKLRRRMKDIMWDLTKKHARSCATGDKVYVYHAPPGSIYLNAICEIVKMEYDGVEYRLEQLTLQQKVYVMKIWREAYEQRNSLPETDAVTLHGRSTIDMETLRNTPSAGTSEPYASGSSLENVGWVRPTH